MAQTAGRIVTDEDVLGGKPHIVGHRISVDFIHERVEGRGLDPETVADRHGLPLADVYRALAYYHEHPDEMADIERERERLVEAGRKDPDVATGPADAPLDPDRE